MRGPGGIFNAYEGYGVYEHTGPAAAAVYPGGANYPGYGAFGLSVTGPVWRCPPGANELYAGSGTFAAGSCFGPTGFVAPVQMCPEGTTQSLPGVCTEGVQVPPPPVGSTPCPPGQVGFPSLGLPCAPLPGVPQASPPSTPPLCPPGQVGWPPVVPCTTIAGFPLPQGSPPPQMAPQCPPGQVGWPPIVPCMAIPAAPPGMPPTIEVPPLPSAPPPATPPPTTAPPLPPAQAESKLPSWAIPVGIGVLAVGAAALILGGKKKATPNRRRHWA